MFAPLTRLLHTIIKEGRLVVRDSRGWVYYFGDGTGPEIAIHLTAFRTEWQLARDPELAAGEAYMQGRLVMEQGTIYDFIELAMRNMVRHPLPAWAQAFARLRALKRRHDETNPIARARDNAHHHYDLDQRFYDLFLDTGRQYSCAYFAPGITRLDEAQAAKKRHVAAKLCLKPGLSILDIGCGWGGLARYLAEVSGSTVRGITLSMTQLDAAIAHVAPEKGVAHFSFDDYRTVKGSYDRIVSIGMFEHVGSANYLDFFETVARLLKDDGIALIHAIGRLDGPAPTNPFVAKWIFPGGGLPALSEVTAAIEKSGLILTDIEILRLHYAETLRQWRQRLMQNRDRAVGLAGETNVRMWEFYFAGCEAAFRHQQLMVFQVQLAKRLDTVPLTRDYMVETERRLASSDARPVRQIGQTPLRPRQHRNS